MSIQQRAGVEQTVPIDNGQNSDLNEIFRAYREHYLKLLDLFETRQTWAFNFALLVYGAACAALSQLGDAIWKKPCAPLVIILAIGLPILVLPICLLFADVTVYCAALNAGALQHWRRQGESFRSYLVGGRLLDLDPGSNAFEWLEGEHLVGSLHWIANSRFLLFFIAPVVGLAVSVSSVFGWHCVSAFPSRFSVLCLSASLVSLLAFIATIWAYSVVVRVRGRAAKAHRENRSRLDARIEPNRGF